VCKGQVSSRSLDVISFTSSIISSRQNCWADLRTSSGVAPETGQLGEDLSTLTCCAIGQEARVFGSIQESRLTGAREILSSEFHVLF
jgi:hypothetical protein